MKENRSQKPTFAGIFLLLSFLLPSLVSLYHALYEHQDISCSTDIGIHFHEVEFSCDYDDFVLSTLILEEQFFPEIDVFPGHELSSIAQLDLYLSSSDQEQNPRGPPAVFITLA